VLFYRKPSLCIGVSVFASVELQAFFSSAKNVFVVSGVFVLLGLPLLSCMLVSMEETITSSGVMPFSEGTDRSVGRSIVALFPLSSSMPALGWKTP
jgi:hypothetical protein